MVAIRAVDAQPCVLIPRPCATLLQIGVIFSDVRSDLIYGLTQPLPWIRSMLQLATELNNVSKACRIMGYRRQQFYEIRRNFQTYGAMG